MTDRKAIEARIHLFMTNIRKGKSYDANVVLLAKDIEQGQRDLLISYCTHILDECTDEDKITIDSFLEKHSN